MLGLRAHSVELVGGALAKPPPPHVRTHFQTFQHKKSHKFKSNYTHSPAQQQHQPQPSTPTTRDTINIMTSMLMDSKARAGTAHSDTSIAACAGPGTSTIHGVASLGSVSRRQETVINDAVSGCGKQGDFSAQTDFSTKAACTFKAVKTPAQPGSGTKRKHVPNIDKQRTLQKLHMRLVVCA